MELGYSNMRMIPITPIACIAILGLAVFSLDARIWTDTEGRTVEADYISSTETDVQIRRDVDQKVFQLKLEQLTQADRDFVAQERALEFGALSTADDSNFSNFNHRLKKFRFGRSSIEANYLGVMSLREKTLGTAPYWVDGMSISKSGEIILSSGNGTTSHMKMVIWYPDGSPRDIVPLTYKKTDGSITKEERADDEEGGRFWFFGGQIAHDRDGEVVFTLGACCDNGIFRVESRNPVRLKRLNYCIPSSSLQVPHWDDRYAYIGRGNTIRKFRVSRNSADEDRVVFEMEGEGLYISQSLMLDEDRLIIGLSLPTNEVDERGLKVSGRFGIFIDRKANGYYLVSNGAMGALAQHPTTGQLYRVVITEGRELEIREFDLVQAE